MKWIKNYKHGFKCMTVWMKRRKIDESSSRSSSFQKYGFEKQHCESLVKGSSLWGPDVSSIPLNPCKCHIYIIIITMVTTAS